MKTKLHLLRLTVLTVLLGFQYGTAQTGGAFNGPHNAGTIANPGGDVIYFRDFDSGANENATTNPGGIAPFGYSDATAGNTAGNGTTFILNDYRPGTDVDIAAPSGGLTPGVIALNSGGNEFLYYTVVFAESGNYHIDVNYGHSNANPRGIKFELLDVLFANPPIVLANGSLVKTNSSSGLPGTTSGGSSTQYSNSNGEIINPVTDSPTNAANDVNGTTIQFDVAAGTYVIKMTTIQNGPNYVWFKFVRDGNATTLGNSTLEGKANTLKVFPNPATNGQFQINIDTKWDVYSVLGQKVLSGEGKNVNLSTLTKGVYVLKTPFESKMLVSK